MRFEFRVGFSKRSINRLHNSLPGEMPNWQTAGAIENGRPVLERTQEGVSWREKARHHRFGFLP
jgi:hypothetical protein